MFNLFPTIKSFFQHVIFDEIQDAGKEALLGALKTGKEKGIEVIKSLPFGLGLNDEEAYFAAERYAKEHLGVTAAQIDNLHGYMQPLTTHQKNEIRLLVSRRCQEIKLRGPHGADEQRIMNPDGANLIKDLATCPDIQHFMELLERAGADTNLIDSMKARYRNFQNSAFVQNHRNRVQQFDQSVNNWFANHTY